jgi:hypothetical protein
VVVADTPRICDDYIYDQIHRNGYEVTWCLEAIVLAISLEWSTVWINILKSRFEPCLSFVSAMTSIAELTDTAGNVTGCKKCEVVPVFN